LIQFQGAKESNGNPEKLSIQHAFSALNPLAPPTFVHNTIASNQPTFVLHPSTPEDTKEGIETVDTLLNVMEADPAFDVNSLYSGDYLADLNATA